MADEAFITCVTNDTYALGALVLGHSLRNVQTSKQLAVIITQDVSDKIREQLGTVFDHVEQVNLLDSKDEANLALLTRPDLGVTFTKFHCWRLTRYRKGVFLDADTLVLQNCDELFEREELSAVPDVGWPDCFNSGVFVFRPSNETFNEILKFAVAHGSFDGGDQGTLNMFFSDWRTSDISRHLSFIYNMNANVVYSYLPAYKQFGKDVKIVHFLGAVKPWMQMFNSETGRVEPHSPHSYEHLQMWWNIFMKCVQPNLSQECKGLAGDLARMQVCWSAGEKFQSSEARQYAWERGQIDYMGADAFSNIERKLQSAIGETPSSPQKIDMPSKPPLKIEMPYEAAPIIKPEAMVIVATPPATTTPKTPPPIQKTPESPKTPPSTPTLESPRAPQSPKTGATAQEASKAIGSPTKVAPKVEAAKVPVESPTKTQPTGKIPAAKPAEAVLKKQSSLGEATAAKKGAAAAEPAEKKPTVSKKETAAAAQAKKEPPKKAPAKKTTK